MTHLRSNSLFTSYRPSRQWTSRTLQEAFIRPRNLLLEVTAKSARSRSVSPPSIPEFDASQDQRPKTFYPQSQSHNARIFELDLSPIFEDAQVFGNSIPVLPISVSAPLPLRNSQALSQDFPSQEGLIDVQSSTSVLDSSDSSYGIILEQKVRCRSPNGVLLPFPVIYLSDWSSCGKLSPSLFQRRWMRI